MATRWLVGRIGRAGTVGGASGVLSLGVESCLDVSTGTGCDSGITNGFEQRLHICNGTSLNERPITVFGTAGASSPSGTVDFVRIYLDGVPIRDVTGGSSWVYGNYDPDDFVDHLFFIPNGAHDMTAAIIDSVDGLGPQCDPFTFTVTDDCDSSQPHATLTSISASTVSAADTITISGTITGGPSATSVNAYWCIDGYAIDLVTLTNYAGASASFTETVTIPTDTWNPIVAGQHSIQLIAVDDDFGQGDWSNSLSLTYV